MENVNQKKNRKHQMKRNRKTRKTKKHQKENEKNKSKMKWEVIRKLEKCETNEQTGGGETGEKGTNMCLNLESSVLKN